MKSVLYISKKINESPTGGTRRILGTINFLKNELNIRCSILTESSVDIKDVLVLKSRSILKDKKINLTAGNFKKSINNLKIFNKNYLSFLPMGFFKIVLKKYDVVFCTCPVYANLQVGFLYKLIHPKCKLIIEYRDLHSFNPQYNNNFLLRIANFFEKKILSQADLIITTTAGMMNKLIKVVETEKVVIIRNYISKEDFLFAINGENSHLGLETDHYYNVGYLGTLDSGRDPKIVLDLLSIRINGKQTRLHFVGSYEKQNEYILSMTNKKHIGNIKFYGKVDRITSLKLMSGFDSLFVIINPDCRLQDGYGIPGKLYDYIAMKNDIISRKETFQMLLSELDLEIISNYGDFVRFRAKKKKFLDDKLKELNLSEI